MVCAEEWVKPITRRRLLLVALVLFVLWATSLLTGCASQCVRTDYVQAPIPTHGEVRIAWAFGQTFAGNVYGQTDHTADKAIVSLRDLPSFNNECSLARLGHEVLHAFGGRH